MALTSWQLYHVMGAQLLVMYTKIFKNTILTNNKFPLLMVCLG